jgi:hypothetical protein
MQPTMRPTMQLRWKLRWKAKYSEDELVDVPSSKNGFNTTYFVLQQAWVLESKPDDIGIMGELEWRDIPIEF